MTKDESKCERRAPAAGQLPGEDDQWLVRVAELASDDAGGVSQELLGDYLPMLAAAATSGQFPGRWSSLGTDGFGMSDTRAALRRHYMVGAPSIVLRVLQRLARQGQPHWSQSP